MAHVYQKDSAASTHLFCFSHLRWSFVYQRPQHLMSRAAQEFRTWYVEEPEYFDGPPVLRIRRDSSDVSVVTPLLPRLREGDRDDLLRKMLSGLLSELRPKRLIAWYYTPMALRFTDELEPDRCVYDNMDELSTFAGAPPGLVEWEEKLLSKCDVVYVGGHSLYRAKRHRHDNIHVYPSSVDAAHFRQARSLFDDPADQRDIPHPRLGFFGVVDERMDLRLVREIAALRPDWHLVMIGPTVKIDPESLPRAANIHWLGCKDYKELPHYLAGWDVGFMPFAINDATRFISPTKTPEFLAAGVPVVSTPITDVVVPYGSEGLVEIAADARGFVARAEALLSRKRGPWLKSVDAFIEGMSWDDTWAAMRRQLDAFIPQTKTRMEARRV
jgi:glycosyltransferase involved in cell wall biosynthesis